MYSTNGHDEKQMQENLKHVTGRLNNDDVKTVNKPINEEEIENAITSMKNEKSPGEDGLTKEFYVTFLDIFKTELCELFNNMKLANSEPISMKNAIVKLLYKKGDHRYLKNWRPVSLLNVDYKILSKVMTNRIAKITDKIVPMEQKCGVKGRKLTDIIRNIDTIRDNMEKGYLVMLDQTKAFDRVNHKYLISVLEHMGITGAFLSLTKTLYTDVTSQIMINGKCTEKITIERRVRQGCPYSVVLFVISKLSRTRQN